MNSILTNLTVETVNIYILIPEQTVFSNLKIGTADYINLDFEKKMYEYTTAYAHKMKTFIA